MRHHPNMKCVRRAIRRTVLLYVPPFTNQPLCVSASTDLGSVHPHSPLTKKQGRSGIMCERSALVGHEIIQTFKWDHGSLVSRRHGQADRRVSAVTYVAPISQHQSRWFSSGPPSQARGTKSWRAERILDGGVLCTQDYLSAEQKQRVHASLTSS
jgi:hypothetical protein